MKAHVLESVGKIHLMEIEKPVPAKKDVVVRVMASGICGSDIARIYRTNSRV